MQIGLIGFGYWGKLLAGVLAADGRIKCLYIVSNQPALDAEIKTCLGESKMAYQVVTLTQLLDLPLSGVMVATPENTHTYFANLLLTAGLACFIEKPLALTHQEAKNLITQAKQNHSLLHVDQVFLYDQQFKEFVDVVKQQRTHITDVMVYRSAPMERLKQVSVVGDTFPHDLYQLREGCGLELKNLVSVEVKSTRTNGDNQLASTAIITGELTQLSIHTVDQQLITYAGYHSWCGNNKQRLFVIGNRVTDDWVKWTLSDSEPSTIQVWHNNKLIRRVDCTVQKESPISRMIAAWLSALSTPWSLYKPQMESHWAGALQDSYWLEQALQLSVKHK